MKKLFLLPLAALLSGCLPWQEPKQIVVDGEATIEFEPDIFKITGSIRSRKERQADVLKEISDTLVAMRKNVPAVEGLTNLAIDTSEVQIQPIQKPDCLEARGYRSEEMCPVTGYFGTIEITVEGSPAKLSGYVLSLMSELGAESISVSSYNLSNYEEARQQAIEQAVQNARKKAGKIAAASGADVVGPIRIQYGGGFPSREVYFASVASPAAPPLAPSGEVTTLPQTELDLDPQPIKISEKVVAAFEIE